MAQEGLKSVSMQPPVCYCNCCPVVLIAALQQLPNEVGSMIWWCQYMLYPRSWILWSNCPALPPVVQRKGGSCMWYWKVCCIEIWHSHHVPEISGVEPPCCLETAYVQAERGSSIKPRTESSLGGSSSINHSFFLRLDPTITAWINGAMNSVPVSLALLFLDLTMSMSKESWAGAFSFSSSACTTGDWGWVLPQVAFSALSFFCFLFLLCPPFCFLVVFSTERFFKGGGAEVFADIWGDFLVAGVGVFLSGVFRTARWFPPSIW